MRKSTHALSEQDLCWSLSHLIMKNITFRWALTPTGILEMKYILFMLLYYTPVLYQRTCIINKDPDHTAWADLGSFNTGFKTF